jgi:hypothetical protein
MASPFEHNNRPLRSIKDEAFLLCVCDCCPAILSLLEVYVKFLCSELHNYRNGFSLIRSLSLEVMACVLQIKKPLLYDFRVPCARHMEIVQERSNIIQKWPHYKIKYSQTSVHELNSFLKVVRKPKLFSP